MNIFERIWNRVLEMVGSEQVEEADLEGMLDEKVLEYQEKSGITLEWRESVVDLLKLLDVDSGIEERRQLVIELGLPKSPEVGSPEGNEILRVAVFQKILDNGGNLPSHKNCLTHNKKIGSQKDSRLESPFALRRR